GGGATGIDPSGGNTTAGGGAPAADAGSGAVAIAPPAAADAAVVAPPVAGLAVPVTSTPAGAMVMAGDKHLGVTPLQLSGFKAGESVTLDISLPLHKAQKVTVKVAEGAKLDVKLVALERVLFVRSTPVANISFDGKRVGRTPFKIRNVNMSKPHELVLSAVGHDEIKLTVDASMESEWKEEAGVAQLDREFTLTKAAPVAVVKTPDPVPDPNAGKPKVAVVKKPKVKKPKPDGGVAAGGEGGGEGGDKPPEDKPPEDKPPVDEHTPDWMKENP
ncbi:MAG TPA: PEGA domain-containing protein, partial [Gemmatimonadales bacterium]|nr:PEGA domain-containing protein [Gemmatimonadales bacterium]